MKPKRGQISYLLQEIAFQNKPYESLYQEENYRHLLALDTAWCDLFQKIENVNDAVARNYLRNLEETYIEDHISKALFEINLHTKSNIDDLIKAIYILGTLYDPYYRLEDFHQQINVIESKVREHIEEYNLPLQQSLDLLNSNATNSDCSEITKTILNAINYVLFQEIELKGGAKQILNFKSHIVQTILSGHNKGIPLSLSIIYLIIGRRIGLPLYGVNLPRHFILKLEVDNFLLYIDADNLGRIIYENEIRSLLKVLKLPANNQYLEACDYNVIIKRKLANLTMLYRRKGPEKRIRFLEKLSRNLIS